VGCNPESESRALTDCLAMDTLVRCALRVSCLISAGRLTSFGGIPPYVPPDPVSENQHDSLNGFWWIAEVWPKVVSSPKPFKAHGTGRFA